MKIVLLVEDDEDDRDFFLSVIHQIDNSVVCETAQDGSVAMRHLAVRPTLPDLIFLDLNMPVMNGREFLLEIKKDERLKKVPVIVLSTSADQATISESLHLGAADFVTKPNKLSLLETRLRQIFSTPKYFSNQ